MGEGYEYLIKKFARRQRTYRSRVLHQPNGGKTNDPNYRPKSSKAFTTYCGSGGILLSAACTLKNKAKNTER